MNRKIRFERKFLHFMFCVIYDGVTEKGRYNSLFKVRLYNCCLKFYERDQKRGWGVGGYSSSLSRRRSRGKEKQEVEQELPNRPGSLMECSCSNSV